jgi:Amino acid permease
MKSTELSAAVVLLMTLPACTGDTGTSAAAGSIPEKLPVFVRNSVRNDVELEALAQGRLEIDRNGCLRIGGEQGPFSEMKFAGTFPTDFTVPGMGAALMFAFACFVGFESTTLYGEEARNPERTVPRATYVAIGLIAALTLSQCGAWAWPTARIRFRTRPRPTW